MKSLSKIFVLVGVILISGLTMSCEKEEDLSTDKKTIDPNPNLKIEIVDIQDGDWDYIGDGTYQAAIESSNLGLKSSEVAIYYKLPKLDLSGESIWEALPYEGYKFSVDGSQLLIERNQQCESSCTFKIEITELAAKDNLPCLSCSLPHDLDPIEYTY